MSILKPSFLKSADEHLNDARIDADAAWKTLQHVYPEIRDLEHPLARIEKLAKEHPDKVPKKLARELALSTHHMRRMAEILKRQADAMEKSFK